MKETSMENCNFREEETARKITVKALDENLDEVAGFVDEALEDLGLSVETATQIDMAVEEIFINIASYAYPQGDGDVTVSVERDEKSAFVTITFYDHGIPYDPLEKQDPDLEREDGDIPIGGLGIFITKQSMDEVAYTHREGQNIFRMRKNIGDFAK